jgi:hypothetical protein
VILGGVAVFACSTFEGEGDPVLAPPDSATPVDAGTTDARPPVKDARVDDATADAGPAAAFSLGCGEAVCSLNDAGAQACCYDTDKAPPDAFSCSNKGGSCPSSGRRYYCDDSNDCTALGLVGNVCCGTLATGGTVYYQQSALCVAPQNCTAPGELLLCDRTLANQCAAGATCKEVKTHPSDAGATVFPAVNACRP